MLDGLSASQKRQASLLILVAALGYFVDIFDLLLFGMVRVKSLTDMGVTPDQMLDVGGRLISLQMWGMLIGGILWGVLGDRRGRLSVLFGSITLYSIANFANAYVTSIPQYELWRFLAGLGLAGELGAGITLVAEVLPKGSRGIGTSVVAGVGILGAILGFEVSTRFDWRQAYMIGGALGLVLLALRVGVSESRLFNKVRSSVGRGDIRVLFNDWARFKKFVAVIALGVPLWYLVGILVFFSPEFAKASGLALVVSAAKAVAVCYWGLAIGDLASGFISQALGSRRKAVLGYILFMIAGVTLYFVGGLQAPELFYPSCFLMGLGGGYWALFVTIGAEQFGTDIRATVATSVPNFVRGSVPLLVVGFLYFKGALGSVAQAGVVLAVIVFGLSFWGWSGIEETYDKDLDYTEIPGAAPSRPRKAVRAAKAPAGKAEPKRKAAPAQAKRRKR